MAYHDVSRLHTDSEFLGRVAACYATEPPRGDNEDPDSWATRHGWDMAAQPGFGDAYGYAILNGNAHPGSDPAVITDAQILAGVQSLMVDPMQNQTD